MEYIYPNEGHLQWSVLIVLYPYLTGLVAGAFILASLVNVFEVEAVRPVYRLALLTALAFLIAAPLPLLAHLGQPQRAFEIMITPNPSSAMAMFGYVYLWYLLAVLLLEIWFDYRSDMARWVGHSRGIRKFVYSVLTMGEHHVSEDTKAVDEKISRTISVIGIPSAFFLHGYVGFIFGSIKANPWWSSPIMPIIFIFSAMVSGIALCQLIYWGYKTWRREVPDLACMDTIGKYMFYTFIIDFALESLDLVHRIYEAEESIDILSVLMRGRLFFSQFILQFGIGTIVPLLMLGFLQLKKPREAIHRGMLIGSALLASIGIFAMRWNVVMGGQMYSKSFRGFTVWKLDLVGGEGILMAVAIMCVPFAALAALIYFLPPFRESKQQ